MKEIHSFSEFQKLLEEQKVLILFAQMTSCGACGALEPGVLELAERYKIPVYGALIEDVPELGGQLGIFTVPFFAIFYEGREYHRQARFLDLREAEKRMAELADEGE